MTAAAHPGRRLRRLAGRLSLAGLAGTALAVLLALLGAGDFWLPWLFACHLCLGLGLGAAAMLMVHHLAGGCWGFCVRRPLEAMTATIPAMALLCVPLVFGLESLYPWLGSVREPVVLEKLPWLDREFFLARAALYLLVWCALAWLLVMRSRRADPDATGGRPRALPRLAAIGLILQAATVAFAAIDWIASLQPRWYSSVFGLAVAVGQALGAVALLAAIACAAALLLDRVGEVVADRLHDLGNLLLMLVALDAYLAYSQVFIVWNGNLPHHVVWYEPRTTGFWGTIGVLVIVLQFALPLVALFFRAIKRDPRALLAVAATVLVGRVADAAWTVLPGDGHGASAGLWIAAAAGLGVGGFWLAAFLWLCGRRLELAR